MTKFIISVGLIAFGLILGQIIRDMANKGRIKKDVPVAKYMKVIQMSALLGINPIITLGAFWGVRLNEIKYIILPIMGAMAICFGGVLGYTFSKILRHGKTQTGTMLVSGSFTNMGNFGGLICFVFFGEKSYAFVSMYKLFEEFLYFLVGYPIAKLHGQSQQSANKKSSFTRIVTDPFIIIYFTSILIGIALNQFGITRPNIYEKLNSIFIPLSSILLITSVGFNMRIKAIGEYLKECYAIAAIKFVIIPIIITLLAYFLGLGTVENGLLLKVALVVSAMPPAFNSLIPPQIYGLDVDMANSCWLFCTGALVVVVPLLYLVINLF